MILVLRGDVGRELSLEQSDLILEIKLAFLESLQLEITSSRSRCSTCNWLIRSLSESTSMIIMGRILRSAVGHEFSIVLMISKNERVVRRLARLTEPAERGHASICFA